MKSSPNLLFGVLCLPGDQSHPFAQPTINPRACCICWAGLLGRAVFPPWNEGPNFGSYNMPLGCVCAKTALFLHFLWHNEHSCLPRVSPPLRYSGQSLQHFTAAKVPTNQPLALSLSSSEFWCLSCFISFFWQLWEVNREGLIIPVLQKWQWNPEKLLDNQYNCNKIRRVTGR